MTTDILPAEAPAQVDVKVIDCDVHLEAQHPGDVMDYMPAYWKRRLGGRKGLSSRESYGAFWNIKRLDSYGSPGLPAGSEPDLVYRQLFGDAGVDFAVVLRHARGTVDPDLNAALCHASNCWLASTWLDKWNLDGRLLGSISIPIDNVPAAVREIEEWAGHPGFKQIVIGHFSTRPLGFPEYEPIWAAAARHRLPVAMHFTTNAADNIGATPVGRFQHHVDYHSIAFPVTYSAQLVTWLCGGVFDRYPDFRVVLVEGGFLWYRPVLARLMRHWGMFQEEVQAGGRDPMQYIRDHVRFTTQPIEESETRGSVGRYLELAEADKVLMFSSDYPHYDYDDPKRALPPGIAPQLRRRIMFETAAEFYELPRTRPASPYDLDR